MSNPRFIPAGEDGLPDFDKAVEINRNDDGSYQIDNEPVHEIGEVDDSGDISYDHPELKP